MARKIGPGTAIERHRVGLAAGIDWDALERMPDADENWDNRDGSDTRGAAANDASEKNVSRAFQGKG